MEYKFGKNEENIREEVEFWICTMCILNCQKAHSWELMAVEDWVEYAYLHGLKGKYIKKVYDYIRDNNEYEFVPDDCSLCYVTGDELDEWYTDAFVLPIDSYNIEEWEEIREKIWNKMVSANELKCKSV